MTVAVGVDDLLVLYLDTLQRGYVPIHGFRKCAHGEVQLSFG